MSGQPGPPPFQGCHGCWKRVATWSCSFTFAQRESPRKSGRRLRWYFTEEAPTRPYTMLLLRSTEMGISGRRKILMSLPTSSR